MSGEKSLKKNIDVKERNLSIDLLRVLSMFGVVGLHVFGAVYAGNITNMTVGIIRVFYIPLYCSVNIFALISGYLYLGKTPQTKSIICIWFTTLFWCVVITGVVFMLGRAESIKELVPYLIPYSTDRLWYITCYSFCFFMIPFLNKLLDILSKEQMLKLLVILLFFLSIVTTITTADRFHIVSNGYSAFWLCYMFLWGGVRTEIWNGVFFEI